MEGILEQILKLRSQKISLESIQKLMEIFDEMKSLSIQKNFIDNILEGQGLILQGDLFEETRQEIQDVIKDSKNNREKIDSILILQVIFFLSILKCQKLPLVDIDPVGQRIIVCFPGGSFNILFTQKSLITFEAKNIEAARRGDFEHFTLNDSKNIERFSISLQKYICI